MSSIMKHMPKKKVSPGQIIILGFAAVILIGTLLLMLPISSESGQATDIKTASFTAVSATCVTGLAVVDTASYWSLFGEIVILCMIQIGGLGFMTLVFLVSLFIKRQITPRERVIASQMLGLNIYGGTVRIAKRILSVTFMTEAVGALLLSVRFVPIFGVAKGIYYGVFHAVSAFCNAGFDLLGEYGGKFSSLTPFADDAIVSLTVCALILIGGIGFIVWDDIIELVKHRKKVSVYSKIILVCTVILVVFGTVGVFACEYNNPETMKNMSTGEKILASFFQAVTTRTAGFSTVDNTLFTGAGKLVSILLMVVGGASGSTAGGVKIATVFVVVWAALRASRGQSEIHVFGKRITVDTLLRAVSVLTIYMIAVLGSTAAITFLSNAGITEALYETVSALSTVGLSLSLTPLLPAAAQVLLMIMMFFGRVGILTITYAIMLRMSNKDNILRYPDANILIG